MNNFRKPMTETSLCSHISVLRQRNQGSVQKELRRRILQAVHAILQAARCHLIVSLTTHSRLWQLKLLGSFRPTKQTWILKPDFHLWKQSELAPGSLDSCWCLVSACCKEPFPQCTQAVGLQLKNGTLLHTWPLPSSLQPPSCHRCNLMVVQAGTSTDTASFPCKAHWWWYKARKRREHTNIWHKSKDKMCWMHIVDK